MEFACILKLAFMAALVRLSSQTNARGKGRGLYFKNRFPCTLNRVSLSPLALSLSSNLTILSISWSFIDCLRGSKSNNALETGPRLKNDWLYHMFLFAFPFTFELCLFGSFSWSAFSVWLNSHWTLFAFFARQVEFQTSNAFEIVPN